MTPVDERLIAALARLEQSADFRRVLAWMQESLAEQDYNNRRTTGELLYRGQGVAICLEQIIETAQRARENLR